MRSRHIRVNNVSPGIAIGRIYKILSKNDALSKTTIRDQDIKYELARFEEALQKSREQLQKTITKICRYHNKDQLKIIEIYKALLNDEMLIQSTLDEIKNSKVNAEWAWTEVLSELKLSFMRADTEYLRDRVSDIEYIGKRVLKNLIGHVDFAIKELPESAILILHDVSPAEVVNFPRPRVSGFILETGSDTSHNAIIARSLEMPAVFGFAGALTEFEDGDEIIIDGIEKNVIVNPTKKELSHYQKLKERRLETERTLLREIGLPARTSDEKAVAVLHANIDLLEEVQSALDHGAEGIGLYRTEYLFLDREDSPSEDEQFENYAEILKKFSPKPVTIRTLDIGGDKLQIGQEYNTGRNPALGLRAIRLCLKEKGLFKTQLRALLRASLKGNLRIMLPFISNLDEVRHTKKLITDIKKELDSEKIRYGDPKLGIMIEVPSAAITADLLAKEVDFFSIGTNDLIQHTIGIDRSNEAVSYLYKPFHPAILRLILSTVESAKKANIPCSICGEMAGDPWAAPLFLAWGMEILSMNPVAIPHLKRIVRNLTHAECKEIAERVMKLATSGDIERMLKYELLPIKQQLANLNK